MSATPTIYTNSHTLRRLGSRRLLLITPLVLATAAMGMLGAKARVPDNQIAPGVQVGSLKLGGKSVEEARALLQQQAQTLQSTQVNMAFGEDARIAKTWTADAHKLGLGLDIPATLDDVNRAGREGMLGQMSHLLTGSKTTTVPAHVTVDAAQLRAYLKQIAYKVNRKPRNARLKLSGTSIADYIHDKPGLSMDVDGSIAAVTQAWTRFNGATDAAASPSANPASVSADSAGTDTANAATPSAVPADPNAHQKPGAQGTENKSAGSKAAGTVGTPAVPSDAQAASGASQVDTTPGAFDVELLAKSTPALVTYEDIKQINGVLGTKETDIGGTSNRHSNVALAASRINGTVLRPGETFSYNKTVGPRSVECGFKEAPEIVKGALKPGVGGGVCQVSTTLFNAVLRSNLKIVDRSHHAFPVHYVSPGLDATVVDGDIDFRFQNDTDAPVYIYGLGRNGVLKFRIYGKTVPGREVEVVRGKQSSSEAGVETETDSSLPSGHREVKTPGHPRIDVTWYRVVKENGVEVKREPIVTHYRAIPEVVVVGTAAPRPRPSAPSSAKTTVHAAPDAGLAPAPDNAAPPVNQ